MVLNAVIVGGDPIEAGRKAGMTCRPILLSALLVSISQGDAAGAEGSSETFAKASASLSPTPFGTLSPTTKAYLKSLGRPSCESWNDCEYVDAQGVGHSVDGDRLVVKNLPVDGDSDADLAALGIGRSRIKLDVARNAQAYLDAELECIGIERDECFVMFGDASIKLTFDRANLLSAIRLDDWAAK